MSRVVISLTQLLHPLTREVFEGRKSPIIGPVRHFSTGGLIAPGACITDRDGQIYIHPRLLDHLPGNRRTHWGQLILRDGLIHVEGVSSLKPHNPLSARSAFAGKPTPPARPMVLQGQTSIDAIIEFARLIKTSGGECVMEECFNILTINTAFLIQTDGPRSETPVCPKCIPSIREANPRARIIIDGTRIPQHAAVNLMAPPRI